jgi:hypothetical protein
MGVNIAKEITIVDKYVFRAESLGLLTPESRSEGSVPTVGRESGEMVGVKSK